MAEARLKARAEMNTTEFDRGLAKMKQGVKTFVGGELRSVAGMVGSAFAVTAIAEWGRNLMEKSHDLMTFSRNVGLSTDQLQAFTHEAVEMGHATEDSVRSKLMRLVAAQEKVVNGNKEMTAAFARFGLTEEQVAGMGTEQLLTAIAKGAQESGTSVADLNAIFGRGAAIEFSDALKELNEKGFAGMVDGAKKAGVVLEESIIRQMENTRRELDRTKDQMSNFFASVANWIANGIKNFAAFWGAVSGVGFKEASQQWSSGQLGTEREKQDDEKRKAKEKAEEDAKKRSREEELAARKKHEADELQARKDKIMNAPMKITVSNPQAADQYAKMGLFSGGQINNSARMLAERQLRVSEEINRRMDRVRELTEKIEQHTATTADNTEE